MNNFLTTYFQEWSRRPCGMETPLRNHQDISNTLYLYGLLNDAILCLFITCFDLWCQLLSTSFFKKTSCHNGSAVSGKMPQMCRGCPDINKRRGRFWDNSGLSCRLNLFVQHSGWQEMVSLCSLIRLIGVCADRNQPEFLCSRSDLRYIGVHVDTAGGY